MKEARNNFFERHKDAIAPVLDDESLRTLKGTGDLSDAQKESALEQFETKVLTWERKDAPDNARRILLEAAEPAAYATVKPLIAYLQHDERCKGITLVTDNVAGKRFMDERESMGFDHVKDSDKPVLADIEGPFDAALVLVEPKDSPNRPLLFAGRSVYGNESTKVYCMIDGLFGHTTKELFSSPMAKHMDAIDEVFVANELSKQLHTAAVPSLEGHVEVTGSLLLQNLKQSLHDPEQAEEERQTLRAELHIPPGAITVLYSGFPSADYATFREDTSETVGMTMNQKTFQQTCAAMKSAAQAAPDKEFALIVRQHPRAKGTGDTIDLPDDIPINLHIVHGDSPYTYDAVANASDIIACQSTSSEVLYAPYRGVAVAVFGYTGQRMQASVNEKVFGNALETFKNSNDLTYLDSEQTLSSLVTGFQDRPARRPIPPDPIAYIAEKLLADRSVTE